MMTLIALCKIYKVAFLIVFDKKGIEDNENHSHFEGWD